MSAFAAVRRWWTPTAPLVLDNWRDPCDGWRYPLVPVAKELLDDAPNRFRMYFASYRVVHVDFDSDVHIYAWWPIAPVAHALYWWRHETRWRFAIEHALRGRVIDKPEGESWTTWSWSVRPPRAWTLSRTRPVHAPVAH